MLLTAWIMYYAAGSIAQVVLSALDKRADRKENVASIMIWNNDQHLFAGSIGTLYNLIIFRTKTLELFVNVTT